MLALQPVILKADALLSRALTVLLMVQGAEPMRVQERAARARLTLSSENLCLVEVLHLHVMNIPFLAIRQAAYRLK